jgi:hypothetical protein
MNGTDVDAFWTRLKDSGFDPARRDQGRTRRVWYAGNPSADWADKISDEQYRAKIE